MSRTGLCVSVSTEHKPKMGQLRAHGLQKRTECLPGFGLHPYTIQRNTQRLEFPSVYALQDFVELAEPWPRIMDMSNPCAPDAGCMIDIQGHLVEPKAIQYQLPDLVKYVYEAAETASSANRIVRAQVHLHAIYDQPSRALCFRVGAGDEALADAVQVEES